MHGCISVACVARMGQDWGGGAGRAQGSGWGGGAGEAAGAADHRAAAARHETLGALGRAKAGAPSPCWLSQHAAQGFSKPCEPRLHCPETCPLECRPPPCLVLLVPLDARQHRRLLLALELVGAFQHLVAVQGARNGHGGSSQTSLSVHTACAADAAEKLAGPRVHAGRQAGMPLPPRKGRGCWHASKRCRAPRVAAGLTPSASPVSATRPGCPAAPTTRFRSSTLQQATSRTEPRAC